MTDEELKAIRDRHTGHAEDELPHGVLISQLFTDRGALLAEVEQLRGGYAAQERVINEAAERLARLLDLPPKPLGDLPCWPLGHLIDKLGERAAQPRRPATRQEAEEDIREPLRAFLLERFGGQPPDIETVKTAVAEWMEERGLV